MKLFAVAVAALLLLLTQGVAHAVEPFSCEGRSNQKYGATEFEKMDIHRAGGANRPAIVIIHGGGWAGGDKGGHDWYAKQFQRKGITVFNINYRLITAGRPDTVWPAQIQDVQNVVRLIRANAAKCGIDPNRICAMGDSAGGHLAMMLGTLKKSWPGDRSELNADQSPAVSCVVDLFGPSDLANPNFNKGGTALVGLFGGKTVAQDPELYAKASPINNVTSQSAATLIFHGNNDTIVPLAQSTDFVSALNAKGVTNQIFVFNGGHWSFDPPSQKNQIDAYMVEWVRQFLHP